MTIWQEDLAPPARLWRPGMVTWLIAATVGAFVIWAALAPLDEIVRAEGQVTARERPQIVQNLEGGILAQMLVAQGDPVRAGMVLARLQGTQFQAAVEDLAARIDAAEIRRLRLEAEIAEAADLVLPEALAARAPAIAASELALFAARRSDLAGQIAAAGEIAGETARELAVMEDLHTRGIAALIELTRARKADADAQARLADLTAKADLERASAYAEVLREVGTLTAEHRLAADRLARTEILSPMDGVVNDIHIATIGGVIRPGDPILEITPAAEAVFVEARVRPENIANVVAGQAATVKLSAYDYTIFGALTGTVATVSADTFEDQRRADLPPYYRVTVALDLSALTDRQREIALRPGLQAVVELHTGQKTVLQYLLKPLMRGREALREP